MMMGGYLACASCHGPDGKGGIHQLHNLTMIAPDIRYAALDAKKKETFADNPSTTSRDKTEYNLDDLRLAVMDGQGSDGSQLDLYMPRWNLSDQDLADLLEYLETLP
jgi:cytochrome c553